MIVSCLRLLHVGDCNQADLESLLRLFELSRDREPIGMDRREPVLGAQHFEIARDDTDNQILLGRLEVYLGFGNAFACLFEANELVPAKNGLSKFGVPVKSLGV